MGRPIGKIETQLTDEQRQLVVDNIKLVYSEWNKLHHIPLMLSWKDDFISEGYWGLCWAAYRFDPEKGFAFSTFACNCIRKRFLHFIRWLNMNVILDDDGDAPMYQDYGADNANFTVFDSMESKLTNWDDIDGIIDLKDMIAKLTPRKRKAFVLWASGWDGESIAAFLNVSYTTMTSIIRNLKKDLQALNENRQRRHQEGDSLEVFRDHCFDSNGNYISMYRAKRWKRYKKGKHTKKNEENSDD